MARKREWLNFWCPIGVGILVCGAALRWPEIGVQLIGLGVGIVAASIFHQWLKLAWAFAVGAFLGATVLAGFYYTDLPATKSVVAPITEGRLVLGAQGFPFDYPDGSTVGGIAWRQGFSRIQVVMKNGSDEAISDIDLAVTPELPVILAAASSDFGDSCRVSSDQGGGTGVTILTGADNRQLTAAGEMPPGATNPLFEAQRITPSKRVFCERLPARSMARIDLAVVTPMPIEGVGDIFSHVRRDPMFVYLEGFYQEGGVKYRISNRILLPPPSLPTRPSADSIPEVTSPQAAPHSAQAQPQQQEKK